MLSFSCHPERSSGFASRSHCEVEGPLVAHDTRRSVLVGTLRKIFSRYRLGTVGILLKLHGKFAPRTSHSAQDDNFAQIDQGFRWCGAGALARLKIGTGAR